MAILPGSVDLRILFLTVAIITLVSVYHLKNNLSLELVDEREKHTGLRSGHGRKLPDVSAQAKNKTRGLVLCAGNRMVKDSVAVVDQMRHIFNSSMPATVAHCGELSSDSEWMLHSQGIDVLDVCALKPGSDTVLGMTLEKAHSRLRGFYCKVAALITSPYDETMVADNDVIWFKKPDLLFESPAYKKTGSLFFRDKLTDYPKKRNGWERNFQDAMEDFFAKEGGFKFTQEEGKKQLAANGVSFFWVNVADRSGASYNNFQDSSVILLDRTTHPKTLEVLTRLLPTFGVGYGDKEIYWMAATIAREEFSFEPFLCGTYGDCGLMMHYDPNQIDNPQNATPFYLNAEWYLSKIHVLGVDQEYEMMNPVLVTADMPNEHLYWKEGPSCVCIHKGCREIPKDVNRHVLRAQWERLSRGLSRRGPEVDCLRTLKSVVPELTYVVDSIKHDNACHKWGCSYTPVYLNHSYDWWSGEFCNPISFGNPTEHMKQLTEERQRPPPIPVLAEGELVQGTESRTVYVVQNQTIHAIPNVGTFMVHGWDFSNVHRIPEASLNRYPRGPDIPSA